MQSETFKNFNCHTPLGELKMSRLERVLFKRERPGQEPRLYEILLQRINGCYYLQTQERQNGTTKAPRGTYYARKGALEKDLTKVLRTRLRKGYRVCYGAPRGY